MRLPLDVGSPSWVLARATMSRPPTPVLSHCSAQKPPWGVAGAVVLNPSDATSSDVPSGAHVSPVTWAPVLHEATEAPVIVFQIRTRLSAVPAPDARKSRRVGHQAIALMAARCTIEWHGQSARRRSQRSRLLSLLPDAKRRPSSRHCSPQTSWVCRRRQLLTASGHLRSESIITAVLEPLVRHRVTGFQCKTPARARCTPSRARIGVPVSTSKTRRFPRASPTAT